MKKEIIILGDIEMGAGTITDDFISDKALAKLVQFLGRKKNPVDLILNGDTFDFLKCPYLIGKKEVYPRHITPKISLVKLHSIHKAHAAVFKALHSFVKKSKNKLYFIIGNHDHDLVFKLVQKELKTILGGKENIFIKLAYRKHRVYVEHGQQYDLANRINVGRLFLTYRGKTILNPLWAFGLLNKIMTIKIDHPFLERIYPSVSLFTYYRPAAREVAKRALKYYFKSIFYYPFRYFSDPTYTFPHRFFREVIQRIKKLSLDFENIFDVFKQKKKHTILKNKILVLGHIHSIQIEEKKQQVLIHTGSWRDDYKLDQENGILTPYTKNYLHVTIDEDNLIWKLVHFPIKRSTLHFDDILMNERKYILRAAEEEGFSPLFVH